MIPEELFAPGIRRIGYGNECMNRSLWVLPDTVTVLNVVQDRTREPVTSSIHVGAAKLE